MPASRAVEDTSTSTPSGIASARVYRWIRSKFSNMGSPEGRPAEGEGPGRSGRSWSSSRRLDGRAGDLGEVDDANEPGGRHVARRVPQPLAAPPEPAAGHAQLDDDDRLGAPAVALDYMEQGPGGLARGVKHADRELPLDLACDHTQE